MNPNRKHALLKERYGRVGAFIRNFHPSNFVEIAMIAGQVAAGVANVSQLARQIPIDYHDVLDVTGGMG
ncbi:MAG: hypothetical protein ACTSYQ_00440 [Candidatus Odinarchaeia archaeon]